MVAGGDTLAEGGDIACIAAVRRLKGEGCRQLATTMIMQKHSIFTQRPLVASTPTPELIREDFGELSGRQCRTDETDARGEWRPEV